MSRVPLSARARRPALRGGAPAPWPSPCDPGPAHAHPEPCPCLLPGRPRVHPGSESRSEEVSGGTAAGTRSRPPGPRSGRRVPGSVPSASQTPPLRARGCCREGLRAACPHPQGGRGAGGGPNCGTRKTKRRNAVASGWRERGRLRVILLGFCHIYSFFVLLRVSENERWFIYQV